MRRADLALVRLMVVASLLCPDVAAAETVRVQFVVQVKSAAKQGSCESPEDPALSDHFAPPGRWITGEFSYDTGVVGTRQREGPGAGMLTFKFDPRKADLRLSIGPGSVPISALAHISPALANDGHGDRTFTFNFQWRTDAPSKWPAGVEVVALGVQLSPKNDRGTTSLPASLSIDGIVGSRFRMVGVPKGGTPAGTSYPWVVCGHVIALGSSSTKAREETGD